MAYKESTSGATLPYGAKAYRNTTTQSVGSDASFKIELNAESWDLSGEFDPTTNARYTALTAGYYLVTFAIDILAAVADKVYFAFPVLNGGNGVAATSQHSSNTSEILICGAGMVQLAIGDYLELFIFQNSGSSATVKTGDSSTYMTVQRLY